MRSFISVVLCAVSVSAAGAYGQSTAVPPLQIAAGTVVTFYSQTRLHPGAGNALDELRKGTVLKVKLLETVDSNVDHDGLEFRGSLATPLQSGTEIFLHADAEVRGLLVLLRNRNHPDGFRYELLITKVSENGKSFDLTASLNPSFFDGPGPRASNEPPANEKEVAAPVARIPTNKN